MREWIIENALATEDELDEIEDNSKTKCKAKQSKQHGKNILNPIKEQVQKQLNY